MVSSPLPSPAWRALAADPVSLRWGWRLAALNVILAALGFTVVVGALFALGPHFPLVELAMGVLAFLVAWAVFLRRWPAMESSSVRMIALWGAMPFWLAALAGYSAAILLAAGGFRPASVFAYTVLASGAALWGLVCWTAVVLLAGARRRRGFLKTGPSRR